LTFKTVIDESKNSVAVYCVNENRFSWACIKVLEWQINADGMKMVDPGGKRMISFRFHKMRWPPLSGSKSPSDVMEHQPQARFAKLRWGKVTVRGPKLNVAAAKTEVFAEKLCLRYRQQQGGSSSNQKVANLRFGSNHGSNLPIGF
jgi:hypothetical protein